MGGLAGCTGPVDRPASATIERMLLAPAARDRAARRARTAPVAVFGERDVDLAEDRDARALVAISGYVRLGDAPSSAAGVLERWRAGGERTLSSLGGEFALAVRVEDRVVVARDALGTRPMYVAELRDGRVLFSTSLFALLYAGVPADLDHDAVVRSLVLGYPPAPSTALARVRQLGPGELWELAPRRRVRRWFELREKIDRGRPLARAVDAVDRALTRAVRSATPPAGRVAAFLSGGVDSSVVLARLHEAGTAVDAYTLYFGDAYPTELRYSRAVAEHLGVPHHVLEIDGARFCDGIEAAALQLEDFVSEAIAVPNFLLAREAARRADVLFTGEGGDQSFGGPKNLSMAIAYAYRGHPAAPRLADSYVALHHYLWGELDGALEPALLAAFDRRALADDVGARFFGDGAPRRGQSLVGRVMLGNTVIKGGSNILVKAAKMIGAAHDVALRSPLYDRRLVELALTIPPWQKLDGTAEKWVLRRAAARSLPEWVVNRPKRGMTLPIVAWFDGPLGTLARDVLTPRAVAERGILRPGYVQALLARAAAAWAPGTRAGTPAVDPRAADKLWLALMTELHHRTIDRVADEARRPPARAPAEAAYA